MAKAATLAAMLGLLLVAATATTLKIEVNEEETPFGMKGSGCYDQFQRAQMLNDCRNFLMEVQRGSVQCGPVRGRGVLGSYHFNDCCHQLSMMDERCMCEGLKQMVMQERFQGHSQEMMQCASELPRMCRMGRSCYQSRGGVSD